jgi:hypothetical protein
VNSVRSVVLGSGAYLPAKILTNDDIAKMVDTSDEWIQQRTGIRERHVAADGEFTSDLAAAAATEALTNAGLLPGDIDAGQHVPGGCRFRAGETRHHAWFRLRRAGGLLRVYLRTRDR